MALGMEMLVGTVIKAIGLNPDEVIAQAKNFADQIITQVKNFDNRLTILEKQNAHLIEQNAVFVDALKAQGLVSESLKKVSANAPEQIEVNPTQEV
jgi:hypothetical protein